MSAPWAMMTPLTVLFGQLHRTFEKSQPAQHRFAALPRYIDLGAGGRRHQLLGIGLESRFAHQVTFTLIEIFLGQEKAVLATQIAGGTGGLGEEMIGRRRSLHVVCLNG